MEKSVDHEIWMHIFEWNPDKQSLPFEHEPAFKVGDDIWAVSAINVSDYSKSKVTDVVKGELWIVKDQKTIKVACYCYETDGIFRIYDYNQSLHAYHTAKELIKYVESVYDDKVANLKKQLYNVEKARITQVYDIAFHPEEEVKNV